MWKKWMGAGLLASPALLLLTQSWSQELPVPTIRTSVPVVGTSAIVTDRKGNLVNGEFEKHFVLLDNGHERAVQVDTEYRPLSLVVLIQTNRVSVPMIRALRQAGGLIDGLLLGEKGEVAMVTYEREVKTVLPFTTEYRSLKDQLAMLAANDREPARLLDGVEQSLSLLRNRAVGRRRVILVLGESTDRGSNARWDSVALHLQQVGAVIYPIGFSAKKAAYLSRPATTPDQKSDKYDPPPELLPEPITGAKPGPPQSPPLPRSQIQPSTPMDIQSLAHELSRLGRVSETEKMARLTGGRTHLSFIGRSGVEQAITRVGEDLHEQYWLTFTPDRKDPAGYHTLSVQVRDRPDLVVRARSGYWLTPAGLATP